MFVRDGRTLPYIPVTIAALNAIRAVCEQPRGAQARSYPHALATYVALLELANRSRGDRVASGQTQIADRAGASRRAVQRALTDLVDAGVLEIHEQHHNEARIENEYVIVEPPPRLSDAGVASDRRSRARPSRPSDARDEDREEKQSRTRASARVGGDNGVALAANANGEQHRPESGGSRPLGTTGPSDRQLLAAHVIDVLVNGIDGLTNAQTWPYPRYPAIERLIDGHDPDVVRAVAVAVATRSHIQAENRARNVEGLFATQLRNATADAERIGVAA